MDMDDIKEKASDAGIKKAGDAVEDKTGGKGGDQIDKVEKTADDKIGQ